VNLKLLSWVYKNEQQQRVIDKKDITIKGKTMYFDLKESQLRKPHKGLSALIGCNKDFPEDFHQENGNYENHCCHCHSIFYGNKHRIVCKTCENKPQTIRTFIEWFGVAFAVLILVWMLSKT